MKKKIAFFLVLLFIFSGSSYAHNSSTHNKIMRVLIFGNKTYGEIGKNQKKEVQVLEAASYLALDQYNNHGKNSLKLLKEYGVDGLPNDIDEINFKSSSNHRSYTHRGWEAEYIQDKANWKVRKQLLINSIGKIFEKRDPIINTLVIERAPSNKVESFAAYVYYIHILGDILDRTSYKNNDIMIPFVLQHPNSSNRDIFFELKYHAKVLYYAPKNPKQFLYRAFLRDLESLENEARKLLLSSPGGINSKEIFCKQQNQVRELFYILANYLPKLNRNSDFFISVFKNTESPLGYSMLEEFIKPCN